MAPTDTYFSELFGRGALAGLSSAVLLINCDDPSLRVITANAPFLRLMGQEANDVVGEDLMQVLTSGAPIVAISRSACKDVQSFCACCGASGLGARLGETSVLQPVTRADGAPISVLSMLGLVRINGIGAAAIVLELAGDGYYARMPPAVKARVDERQRATLAIVRAVLAGEEPLGPVPPGEQAIEPAKPEHCGFYAGRLEHHSFLEIGGCSGALVVASRREAQEIRSGCIVFTDRPVALDADRGLVLSLRLDTVMTSFEGPPLMGFTRRRPTNDPGLYPQVSWCLGQSVLIGSNWKAYARDKASHFSMTFDLPSKSEVQTWSATPEQSRLKIVQGDILTCVYTWEGRLQFWVNGILRMDFDTERHIDREAEYFGVVDVSFSAARVTLVPTPALNGSLVVPEPEDIPVFSPKERSKDCKDRRSPADSAPSAVSSRRQQTTDSAPSPRDDCEMSTTKPFVNRRPRRLHSGSTIPSLSDLPDAASTFTGANHDASVVTSTTAVVRTLQDDISVSATDIFDAASNLGNYSALCGLGTSKVRASTRANAMLSAEAADSRRDEVADVASAEE